MSGPRLVVGIVVMGIAVPAILFFLLGLQTVPQLLTVAATTFTAWGVANFYAAVLERPRLQDRTPTKAWKEDWERRSAE